MSIRKQVQDLKAAFRARFDAEPTDAGAGAIFALDQVLQLLGDPADDGAEVDIIRKVTLDRLIEPCGVLIPAGGRFSIVHVEEE